MADHDKASEILRMANQIATAFQAYPHDEAVKETANHIKSFWDPRMRKHLAEILAQRPNDLSAIAREAGRKLGL
ncbi:MAG: formate dehydrogenase subunit delta [Parvibaculaceae bacterium]